MHDCLIERYFLEEENSWKFCYALLMAKKTVGKISTNKKLSFNPKPSAAGLLKYV